LPISARNKYNITLAFIALTSGDLAHFFPHATQQLCFTAVAQCQTSGSITDLLDKYYVVLAALGKMQVERAKKVVDANPDITSLQWLREAPISSHMLIPFKQ
jgi:hypothetical protein